jgi:hypothetical protein
VIDPAIHCRRLSEHLSTLHTAMEDLVYHLEVHVLTLSGAGAAVIQRSTTEVEQSATVVATTELARAEYVAQHAPQWAGLPLSAVVDSLDEPWRGVLDHQRSSLEALQSRAATLSEDARRAANLSSRRSRDILQAVTGPREPLVAGYGASTGVRRAAPILVDRSF